MIRICYCSKVDQVCMQHLLILRTLRGLSFILIVHYTLNKMVVFIQHLLNRSGSDLPLASLPRGRECHGHVAAVTTIGKSRALRVNGKLGERRRPLGPNHGGNAGRGDAPAPWTDGWPARPGGGTLARTSPVSARHLGTSTLAELPGS